MSDSTMTSDPNPDARGLKLVFAFASIYLIWGSMYLAIRWGLDGIPPLILMGLRHLAAALILLAWLVWRGVKINHRLWKPALATGAIMFLGSHGLLSWAELRVGSGLASMIGATEPIIMVLLAGFLGQERHASGRIVLGMVLGLVGIGVLVGVGHGHDSTLGTVAVLASAILWSVGAIYGRGVDNGGSVIMFAAMQMLAGGALLLTTGVALGERLHFAQVAPRAWWSLAYMVIFGSIVAFSSYVWLLKVTSAARVAMYCYVNPVVAVLLGWQLADEKVTLPMITGAAIVLTGVLLVNTAKHEPAALPEPILVEEPGMPAD
jgi:drug/metabolite transporter (DMT)-like permease